MPVPSLVKYEVPTQTKKYFCNHCQNQRDSLRWIEKFSTEHFKCDDCWHKSGA